MKRFPALLAIALLGMAWMQGLSAATVQTPSQLMITNLKVVEDPVRTNPRQGAKATWSFKYLMEQMAGSRDPAEFTLQWLQQWENDQFINGHLVTARPNIRSLVINPWLAASGGKKLDLNKAPFKLLAIVNRMDMREHDAQGSVTTAGEGRFVFGVLGADGKPLPPAAGTAPGGFTVILEYELSATTMRELGDWAKQWKDLGKYALGSAQYNTALETLTRRFTDRGRAPGKPNQNAINQIRTNEIALRPAWELREFAIDGGNGLLQQKTVTATPDSIQFNGTEGLTQLINDNEASILGNTFTLGGAFEAASSISGPFQATNFADFGLRTFKTNLIREPFYDIPWSAAGIRNNTARHQFALNTCNGCHRDETATGFLHIGFPQAHSLPASLGKPAALSAFLTGGQASDPVDATTLRQFAELTRRQADFAELLDNFGTNGTGPGPRKPHRPKFVH